MLSSVGVGVLLLALLRIVGAVAVVRTVQRRPDCAARVRVGRLLDVVVEPREVPPDAAGDPPAGHPAVPEQRSAAP